MSRRVLVAPLDWGLGHATRCVPVIRTLLAHGCTVLLAGSGTSLELLQREFPQLTAFTLPGYRPRYAARGSMVLAMGLQVPKFMLAIYREHGVVEELVRTQQIDLVLADNRYGCYTAQVPCILMTHQSNILMPAGFGWLARWVRGLNVFFMKKFSVCWVPDEPGGVLSGDLLGFGKTLGCQVPFQFTGVLSRFKGEQAEAVYDVVAVCSGPEPQRAIFEKLVTHQLERSGLSYVVVRGAPGGESEHVRGLLDAGGLEALMARAGVIIARSGYSTLMDLAVLGKPAILVPTPGQTEQEYLARRMMEKGIAYAVAQHQFDLRSALVAAKAYSGFVGMTNGGRLDALIRDLRWGD